MKKMKRLLLVCLALGTIVVSKAQEPKSVLLYGDLNLNSTRDSLNNTQTIWDATFGVGYQFNPHWTIGGNISWGQNASKDGATGDKATYNTYKVGPFARYSRYMGGSEIFFWYAQWDFLYQGGYHTHEGDPANYKHSGIYTGIYPAIGINVCKSLCLNFNIGGLNYTTDQYDGIANGTSGVNFTFGHQVNVGISKNFSTGHRMHSSHEPGEEIHKRRIQKTEDEDEEAPKPKRKERNRDEDE
jgi:hypothetical protein